MEIGNTIGNLIWGGIEDLLREPLWNFIEDTISARTWAMVDDSVRVSIGQESINGELWK